MSTEHSGSKATVMIIDVNATLRLESPGGQARVIDLGGGWKSVSNVRFSPNASRVAIVADAATPQVLLVDVPSAHVIATYPITTAVVSPDGRAVILEHSSRGVALVPLNTPDDSSVARASNFNIHTDGRSSVRQSDFHWTDPEVVAFIELVGTEARVVALQVDPDGRIQKRGEKALSVADYVDTTLIKGGVTPATAMAAARITRIPSAGLTLRLEFPPNPALRRRTADVRLWE
jgi:hypothetical protein